MSVGVVLLTVSLFLNARWRINRVYDFAVQRVFQRESAIEIGPRIITIGTLVLLLSLLGLRQADAADSELERQQITDQAMQAESSGDYHSAVQHYQRLLSFTSSEAERSSITVRLSILKEAERQGYDSALPLLLDSMTARADGNFDLARGLLTEIENDHLGSYLHDDALYLQGYIALLDQFDFNQAQRAMSKLLTIYPESKYHDTALYSQAIAVEQLGNTEGARALFTRLRDRHSEFSIGIINRAWPKSSALSRYWFDRADKRLGIIAEREQDAAKLVRQKSTDDQLRVQVNVQGLDLNLLLKPSSITKQTQFATQSSGAEQTRLYSGHVENEADSWARVSIDGESIVGVVQIGGQRYVLDSESMIGTIEYYRPRSKRDSSDGFPLQDYVMHPPQDGSSDLGNNEPLGQVYQDVFKRVSASAKSVSKMARLAIVVDSQYDSYYGGQGLNQALAALNVADGIYRDRFGLALEVMSAKVIADRSSDPMNLGAVSLETMLRNFRDYRMQRTDDFAEASLVYLFSGNQNSDQAIGLAWIGAACRLDGFDVGVTTPSSFSDLLVTHELGHSLGAQHDTDTACSSETNQVMWPRISSSTQQQFSQCSRNVIQAGLDNWCLSDAIDVALEWQDTDTEGLTLAVYNNDADRTVTDTQLLIDRAGVSLDSSSNGCADDEHGQLSCRTGSLAPGESRRFEFRVDTSVSTSLTLLAELSPIGFADVVTSNNAVQMDVVVDEFGNTSVAAIEVDNPSTGNDAAGSGSPVADSGGGGDSGGSGALTGGAIALLALLNLSSVRSRGEDKL